MVETQRVGDQERVDFTRLSDAKLYRSEIDGLRALAVVAVILFHLDIPGN